MEKACNGKKKIEKKIRVGLLDQIRSLSVFRTYHHYRTAEWSLRNHRIPIPGIYGMTMAESINPFALSMRKARAIKKSKTTVMEKPNKGAKISNNC